MNAPPQDREAEEHVLGAMMLAPAAVDRVLELGLTGADFYHESHGRIFEAAVALHVREEPVDPITVRGELEHRGELEKVGGRVRVHEIARLVPASANVGHYAQLVQRAARRRDEARLALALGQAAQNGGLEADEELKANLRALLDRSVQPAADPGATGLRFERLDRFAAGEEETGESLVGVVGHESESLLPADGTALLYGDGGAGKSTLAVDLAAYAAAGAAWLGLFPIGRRLRVVLLENEGSRARFRLKLRRKVETWQGPPFAELIFVLADPWAEFTFADERRRAQLAARLAEHDADILIAGPLAELGASGKTLLGALVGLWTCLLRPEVAEHIRRRERLYSVAVATNHRQARLLLEQARTVIEGSPMLAPLLESAKEDELVFANRSTLAAFPATSRGGRGWPIACLVLDEAAHMLDGDGNQAAEPLYRALAPSTAQFGDTARVIVASSPFGTDGWFADLYGVVEKGDLPDAACAQRSTLEMRPGFQMAALELERRRDPEGFRAEYLAEFVAPGGAFLDAGRVAHAASRGGELRPAEVASPVAAIDLGFVHDSTALAIVGRDRGEPRRLRLVLARSWKPEVGPLGFGPTLDAIADVCLEHGVRQLYTDQYSAEAAVEHLSRRGLYATSVPTTAQSKSQMFGDLKTRIYAGDLELYGHDELLAELARVETVTTPGAASVRIRRLGASHGDLATAVALAAWKLRGTGSGARLLVPTGRIPGVDRRTGYATALPGRDRLAEALALHGIRAYDRDRASGDLAALTATQPSPAPVEPVDPHAGQTPHDPAAELNGYLGGTE